MQRDIVRCDPFQAPARFGEALDQFFNEVWSRGGGDERAALHAPAIDVRENERSLVVTAELPGMEKKDIEVQVKDGVLVLRGEKKFEEERQDGKFHRIERRYGSFYRALALPDTVDADRIDATLKNGVLTVALTKHEARQPRTISIKE